MLDQTPQLFGTTDWKIIISSLTPFFRTFFLFLRNWWWIFLPFLLKNLFIKFWLFWRIEEWLKKNLRPILLEIKIPKESLKPTRAMENVFAGLWQAFWDPPNFWEKWWDGKISLGFQLELVSIGGEIHFYIRCPDYRRAIMETTIYSQYPEAEIILAEDYTKKVPLDMPNKVWDLWGSDYRFTKSDPYPIKTYQQFETETEREEEKRIDPLAVLLESMAKINPGEQLWVQFQVSPIAQEAAEPFLREGQATRDKLAKRPEKIKPKPFLFEFLELLITGKTQEPEKEEMIFPPEMRLTPGERETIQGVERKISKPCFQCGARFIFLGKRDVWEKAKLRLPFSFFGSYVTADANALVPLGNTITKVYSRPPFNIFDDRRLYLRKRRIFRQYRERFEPLFPRASNWQTGYFVLSIEELASLFHFPSWRVAPAPGVPRVEIKKGPPPSLPYEE